MRGDVFQLRAPKHRVGHEQQGQRYAVVLQSDHLLQLSTWLVAPTSTRRQSASFRPEIEIDGQKTRVLVEQTGSVDPEVRLGEFSGRLTAEEMMDVDRALMDVLGLR